MVLALVIVLAAVVLLAALRLWITANRLDRLHVRTEAAWVALEGALSRRIVAARAAAAAGAYSPAEAAELRRVTAAADRAERRHRAEAEAGLARLLSELPPVAEPELAAELADANERVTLARSFYNDAVRDTHALREEWFTRSFRLAGSAALPAYFENADASLASPSTAATALAPRTAARVVMMDPEDRILLFCSTDAQGEPVWFTPGGGVEDGEDLLEAAVREVAEETGQRIAAGDLAGPFWRRRAQFVFAGVHIDQTEFYLATTVPHFAVDTAGFTPLEQQGIAGHRWWTPGALRTTTDTVYPVDLADRLPEVKAALAAPGRTTLTEIS